MTVTHHSSLEALAERHAPSGTWWASVARALDDLDERLAQDCVTDDGPEGAFVEAVTRDPALSNETARLRTDHARLTERARRLRRFVAQVAGDPGQSSWVSLELGVLAEAEDRYRQRSRAVFWDSFARDIGGE